MQVISISNIKGGCSKTSTVAVTAAALARQHRKVLLIDADPQTNLTMCFLPEQPDETPSLYHVYGAGKSIDEVKVAVGDGIDLVIGDFELCNADMQFTKPGRLKMLQKALRNLETEYDFVLIDTPPNLGLLSLNAFLASDYVIVPIAADSFSLKGVRLIRQVLDEIKEEIEKELPVAGVLLTRYNSRTKISKLLEKSINAAAEMLDAQVFNSRIRQAVVLQESQIAKEDLFLYAPKAAITEDYRQFTVELIDRIEG